MFVVDVPLVFTITRPQLVAPEIAADVTRIRSISPLGVVDSSEPTDPEHSGGLLISVNSFIPDFTKDGVLIFDFTPNVSGMWKFEIVTGTNASRKVSKTIYANVITPETAYTSTIKL